jgi:HK97 family phage major capsid protein
MAGMLLGAEAGGPPARAKAAATEALGLLAKGASLAEIERKDTALGSDPDGGYLSAPVMAQSIRERVHALSPVRQLAAARTLETGDTFDLPVATGEEEAAWIGETAARPATASAPLALSSIPLAEMYAAPKITQKLLDCSPLDLGNWLEGRIARRLARLEGAAFVAGDGVAKPRGILSYTTAATGDSTRSWGTIEHVPTGADGVFASTDPADCLVGLVFALKAEYLANARWLMARSTAAVVAKLNDAEDRYLWQPSLAAGQPPTLLGHPVVFAEDMPAIGSNSLSVAFGDFSQAYQVVDGARMRLLRDPFTARPFVIFYCYSRVGGAVVDFDAVKLLKFAAA